MEPSIKRRIYKRNERGFHLTINYGIILAMIELLILYKLSNKILTMYGISKDILDDFSVLTTPSFGTIKPALNRLSKNDFVKSQKTMSQGGRPSVYYSITQTGLKELKRLLLDTVQDNPIQFITIARVRLTCANILNNEEQKQLFSLLKNKAEEIIINTNNLLKSKQTNFYQNIVLDNLICEYKNLISLLEGLERAGKN